MAMVGINVTVLNELDFWGHKGQTDAHLPTVLVICPCCPLQDDVAVRSWHSNKTGRVFGDEHKQDSL